MSWSSGHTMQQQSNVTQNTREAMEICQTDIFAISNKQFYCIIDCHRKFLVVKQVEGFITNNQIKMYKIIFSEYRLSSKKVSNIGTNFISEKSKNFYKKLSIWHAVSSTYNHQSNGQEEAFIKLIKRTENKCYGTNADISYIIYCRQGQHQ